MSRRTERGQAILLIVLAMGIFMIAAVGLAIDGAQLYGQHQMGQVAADAAAQAGILSIFNGTNVGSNAFGSAAHTCSTTDTLTPCVHARKNGFGATSADTVTFDFPSAAAVGLDPASLSTSDPVNVIRVTITRDVGLSFTRLVGAGATTPVKAIAAAAIVSVESPTPIVVTHPSIANSLSTNGTTTIQICGGPSRSIQVNSSSASAFASPKAGGLIDLSKAGPADPGNCTTGTGASFGTFGGATSKPSSISLGTTGKYIQPSSIVEDPFKDVPAPSAPAAAGTKTTTTIGNFGCVFTTCTVYSPGLWTGGIDTSSLPPSESHVIFKPGLYYIRGGGFKLKNVDGGLGGTTYSAMCSGCTPDPDTGTGMVVYDTGSAGSTTTGGFDINTNVSVTLQGSTKTTTNSKGQSVPAAPYYNMLFWEDRSASAHTGSNPPKSGGAHSLGQGNGCFTLLGTIYATNTRATMLADPAHYQEVDYNGTPCSSTVQQGYIIVSSLQIVGTTAIRMNLVPYGFLTIRQVALVR